MRAGADMDGSPQKLRSLARQSRALSFMVTDRQRASALQSLARLYEKQAADLEARQLAKDHFPQWVESGRSRRAGDCCSSA